MQMYDVHTAHLEGISHKVAGIGGVTPRVPRHKAETDRQTLGQTQTARQTARTDTDRDGYSDYHKGRSMQW